MKKGERGKDSDRMGWKRGVGEEAKQADNRQLKHN